MAVDVLTEIEIACPRDHVAAFASDPGNATAWYKIIKAVEWRTSPPLAVGSQIAFVADFLGRRLAYTYEIREMVPGELLLMSNADGPFPMETTYAWDDAPGGGTHMTLRNRGQQAGFAKLAAIAMASAMRRANRLDLRALKTTMERDAGG